MNENNSCLTILQLSDLHVLPTPEDRLLGIATEHYFNACLEQAVRLRSRQAVCEFGTPTESPIERPAVSGVERTFDLILLTGDLAQDPCRDSYLRILNSLESYKTPCLCLPGNHDDYPLMQQVFHTDRVNCRKQVFLDNWQLISLNSQIPGEQGGHLSKQELFFLEDCLSANPNHHALIALHHHCLETKSPWMDSMILDNRLELLAITEKYPQVKVITNGHIHQVLDIKLPTVRVLGAPSTCFQFVPGATEFGVNDMAPGYRLIDLYADGRVESQVVRLPEPLVGLQMNKYEY
ncbi:MAG: metallophosphoesterase [Methylococcaceae bacterium]